MPPYPRRQLYHIADSLPCPVALQVPEGFNRDPKLCQNRDKQLLAVRWRRQPDDRFVEEPRPSFGCPLSGLTSGCVTPYISQELPSLLGVAGSVRGDTRRRQR
eukprot:11194137-Lingulodinium_polyedra.AAC.1